MDGLLTDARQRVARFVGCDARRLGFVANATEGINAVLRSLVWQSGDEIVVLDHVYNAMRQSIRRLERAFGVVLREARVELPVASPDAFYDAVRSACTARTRMILIDQVTSPTAMMVPVAAICEFARNRGIFTLVDGAHGPGSVGFKIDELGCDAYTANLHKWICAPKGAAILVAADHFASHVHPLATSHRFGEGMEREFDWQGTRDMTPWLTAPQAIAFFERFGWDRVRHHNHAMAVWSQHTLCERWGVEPLTPIDGSLLASMAPVRVPESVQRRFPSEVALQACLYDQHRIEIPVIAWGGRWHVRVSCHLHTTPALVERLSEVVLSLAA
jgi:isopenicillin-N epimerase